MNPLGVARQKHRGLAGGIAAADQHDLLFRAQPRLDRGGPVPDAAAFEFFQVFDLGPPIARAARHHDGARAQRVAAIECQREGAIRPRAIERPHADRDHDIGAELLRLAEGAARQRLPRDPRREAEIILDPRAGAGLAAVRTRIQYGDRKTFRGGIHRGRKTRGTAADDRRVVDFVSGGTADHAERAGELGFAGIAQHGAVGDHRQRPIGRGRRITRDQFGGIAVPFRIEQVMRKTVAGQKSLQANDAAGIRRADQHRAADPALDQIDPAQDQRAHDALAEIGFGDQQRAQALRRNQKRLDVALGVAVDQRNAPGERADFGKKLTRSLLDHRRDVAQAIALGDRDMAGQYDEHARSGLAGLEQPFAILVMANFAEPAHVRDLLRRQRRERLLSTRKRGRERRTAICLISSRAVHAHRCLTS